jgi:tetratricopeptide (TPR) repeat protein
MAWWVNALPDPSRQPSERRFLVRQAWGLLTASLVFLLLVVALVFFYQPAQAAWQANLGALRQSHSELSEYEPVNFEKRSIDVVRKEAGESLFPAEASYQRALEIDPTNRTALQRLASLAFSRENYAESLSYAQALWQAGHRDPTSRLLYGEALAANGQIAQAAEVLSGVTWAEFRLMGTAWYRYWLGGDAERAANAWSVVLLLNPENQDAVKWLKEAQSKIK